MKMIFKKMIKKIQKNKKIKLNKLKIINLMKKESLSKIQIL